MAKILLENGAQVDLQKNDGWSALLVASQKGHAEVAKILLENGAQVDLQDALLIASWNGHTEMVMILLENGAQVDLQYKNGSSALYLASQNGHTEVAKILLENGAQVDLQHKNGSSALLIASQNGHTEVAKILLENGAQIDLQDKDGWSSLLLASQNGHTEMAMILLENGVQVDLRNKNGCSALYFASQNGHTEVAKILLENGAQVDLQQWVVRKEDIELTGPEIGRGGWATVSVAKFRGVQVAVKRIHNQIVSQHNEDLFRGEMQMAARLRHPNLVQFIGATIRGDMMILMELMPTSLRRQIETDEYFPPKIVKLVSLDIVKALNYLHQMKPDPMIHRDISSANVLLEPLLPPKYWKAKITDYGSVNLVRQLHTENPGSPAYSAPEAGTPSQQTTKMDIYSFGVLMLEMLTCQLLAPEIRSSLFRQVHHEHLLCLLQRCLSERPTDRPSAENIMSKLL